MMFVRSTLFNVFFFTVTAILTAGPATYVRYLAPERMLGLAQLWARIMLGAVRIICGIHVEVRGLERLSGEGPKLIASVHQSAFDTMVWLTLLPRCCYVLKKELLRIPVFGGLLTIGGMIAVDRSGGATALRSLLRESERAVREGRQIVIFPEGTRSEPGAVLPLQPGVAALAAKTGLPVYPVITDSGSLWSRRAFHKRPGTIHINILDPIPAGTPRETLMERLGHALHCPITGSAM
jgi:1-acyl-sn-glycerol-3-phosphate acyltransferase